MIHGLYLIDLQYGAVAADALALHLVEDSGMLTDDLVTNMPMVRGNVGT